MSTIKIVRAAVWAGLACALACGAVSSAGCSYRYVNAAPCPAVVGAPPPGFPPTGFPPTGFPTVGYPLSGAAPGYTVPSGYHSGPFPPSAFPTAYPGFGGGHPLTGPYPGSGFGYGPMIGHRPTCRY